ncbi:MAG: DUF3857 domain-containing protein [bacterium]|nr:DUF3857 domain-containing protein [bacterium]
MAGRCNRNMRAGMVGLVVMAAAWPVVPVGQAAPLDGMAKVSQADYPNDDAVILRQDQKWTLQKDGTVIHEEHRWVKLFNDRAWRRYADPRVDYLEGAEQVELLAADAHLPDGTVVKIPDYSTNVVSPAGVSKWPALADWRQVVYTFSGVQNGAVLELHYKRTSQPGVRAWLEADLRLGDIHPVIQRTVQVSLPAGQKLLHKVDHPSQAVRFEQQTVDGREVYTWHIANVASDADEPNCPPWRRRTGRLRLTNCPSAVRWASEFIRPVDSSGEPDDAIGKFAEKAAEDEVDEVGRIRAISGKLRDTVNLVSDWRGEVARRTRPADEVFDSGYGTRLEGAALLVAMLRATGFDAQVRVAVDRETFDPSVPVDSELAGLAIEVATAGGPVYVGAVSGIINPNGAWRDRDLLEVNRGRLAQFAAFASESSQPDTVRVRGSVKLDDEAAKLTGSFNIELTEGFVNSEKLLSDKEKKTRIETMVGQVLGSVKVTDFSVSHLSARRFVAQAEIESTEDLPEVDGRRMLVLADTTPALAAAHLPLDQIRRRTPVQLSGHLTADVRLKIELPEGYRAAVVPKPLAPTAGPWGRMSQTVDADDNVVRIVRQVGFDRLVIDPADFSTVRQAARTLASPTYRSLVIEKKE